MGEVKMYPNREISPSEFTSLKERVTNLENHETVYQIFQYTGTSSTGTVTIPTEASIFDVYNDGLPNQVVVKADGNFNPTEELSKTVGGVPITISSFDNLGNYVLSGTPATDSCIVYFVRIEDKYANNINSSTLVEAVIILSEGGGLLEVVHDSTLVGAGTAASPLSVSPTASSTYITGTALLDFGSEEDIAVATITTPTISLGTIKSVTFIPIETTATSLDDFSLNGVTVTLGKVVTDTSFDIIGTAVNNASGIYTVNYIITI